MDDFMFQFQFTYSSQVGYIDSIRLQYIYIYAAVRQMRLILCDITQ